MAGVFPHVRRLLRQLHSMMSVLPNGGISLGSDSVVRYAALDDVSATEWRVAASAAQRQLAARCTR